MKLTRTTLNFAQNIKQSKFAQYFNPEKFTELQPQILPRKLLLSVTNICNANCVFCGYQYIDDPKQGMELDLFEEAVTQYVSLHPASYVSLTPIAGDPLLDRGLIKKIESAKRIGVQTLQCYTNGILLEKYGAELAHSGLDHLEVSLADFDRELYLKIFRVDAYERVLKGLHSLLKMIVSEALPLSVDINLRSNRALDIICKSADFKKWIEPYLSDRVTISHLETFDNWTGLIKAEDLPVGMKLMSAPDKFSSPCTRLFDLQVLSNGDVRLCGCRSGKSNYDDLIIGNLSEASLSELWFSQKAYELRNYFFQNQVPGTCRSCSFYQAVGEKRFFMKTPGFGSE